jgi:hypothetical protein
LFGTCSSFRSTTHLPYRLPVSHPRWSIRKRSHNFDNPASQHAWNVLVVVTWCSRLWRHAARKHGQAGPCTMQQTRVGSNKVKTLRDALTLLHCAALSSRAANTLFAACASPQPVWERTNHCKHRHGAEEERKGPCRNTRAALPGSMPECLPACLAQC